MKSWLVIDLLFSFQARRKNDNASAGKSMMNLSENNQWTCRKIYNEKVGKSYMSYTEQV